MHKCNLATLFGVVQCTLSIYTFTLPIIKLNMKNPWTFTILILIFFGYFAWNNFELPLLGKTEKVIGKIYEIKPQPGLRGMGFVQGISFFYSLNKKRYEGHYVSNSRNDLQKVGNSISLNVLVSNPERFKVIGFFKQSHYKNSIEKFYSNYLNGHSELLIENNIYKQTDYFDSKDSTIVINGWIKQRSDNSIILIPTKQTILRDNRIIQTKILSETKENIFDINKESDIILSFSNNEKDYKMIQ